MEAQPPVFSVPEYIEVDGWFEVAGRGSVAPPSWGSAVRVIEEVTETLMLANLSAVAGLPLVPFRRAWPMDPSPDITASDALGRVHLFELKKASFGAQEASQLGQYLLRHVFDDTGRFLDEQREAGRRQLDPAWVAQYLSGALANRRTGSIGSKWVVGHLGSEHPLSLDAEGRPITKSRWAKLSAVEKAERVHEALQASVRARGLASPEVSFDGVMERAGRVAAQFGRGLDTWHPLSSTSPPLVIWLVGRSIQRTALEQVRLWRRSGIDARVLRIETRLHAGGWIMKVQRERAEGRDRLEGELLEMGRIEGSVTGVRLAFYDVPAPSTPMKVGGGLLAEPSARLTYADGSEVVIRR